MSTHFDELVEDEWVLEDALDRLDENGPHVEAGHLRLKRLHSFLKHLLGLLQKNGNVRKKTVNNWAQSGWPLWANSPIG
jgi:hypothetical protein